MEILAIKPAPSVRAHAYLFTHEDGTPPSIQRRYDRDFRPDAAYRAQLPDMTRTLDSVEGADVAIQQVGVSGFRLPLSFAQKDGQVLTLEARVTGTVSLEAGAKGINMSRILRSFYERRSGHFDLDQLVAIAEGYRQEVGAHDSRLRVQFQLPIEVESLRSGMSGYQYYRVIYQVRLDRNTRPRRFIELDFVYSSACPCSAELAEHARVTRGAYAIPHSQRSKARLQVEVAESAVLHPEDLIAHCRQALQTETQVMVRREDEQAFAELNGAYVKFVEDAARLVFEQLQSDSRIADFQVACAHLESLHSHDAVSVICKGVAGGYQADFMEFEQLLC